MIVARTRSSLMKYQAELAMIEQLTEELASINCQTYLTASQIMQRSEILAQCFEINSRLSYEAVRTRRKVSTSVNDLLVKAVCALGGFLCVIAVFGAVYWVMTGLLQAFAEMMYFDIP